MMNELIEICRQHFQFGWTGSTDIANSVAMETLALPNLLVVNATSYQVNKTFNRLYKYIYHDQREFWNKIKSNNINLSICSGRQNTLGQLN